MTLSIDVLKKALPDKYKKGISQELLDNINQTLADPDLHEEYRDNFVSYISVLNDGKYKIDDYISAVKYCTHKLMGNTNTDSYIKTFPDRYNDMLQKGYSAKTISSFVTNYNKGKLVNLIMEQSMIPTWVINQDLHQKAINVLADLMMNANSEKVRADSANSLLVHLKPPEVKKVELDIGVKANKEIDDMKNLLAELSAKQKSLIDNGVVSVVDVAHTQIVEAEYEELD
ncbi:hypothetical protein [Moraxella bovis]|uniref:Uncharacterized protein n=1 Tax=Moraxella bovis TaxID=476 RepID=A0ABY6M5U6_MORBO|nr:hypothetical protein [Moraxella bovis]UZA02927.1 hypothetical protein LP092_13480 [Moraxella bovis]UZA19142.1 hypothetical protein LP088_12740 [Moraxella bovis]UZA54021.1 hypothetical protein LP111_12700 [Moraxella bovis]UZA57373.1 hypothetical protein LP127_01475 [Moraxella bovis]